MEKVAIINNLYFEQRKSLTEIAEIINTSISYISKTLRKNDMYKIEKEKRKEENQKQRKKVQKDLIYSKRESKTDIDYINLKSQHEQDINELSKHSTIGNQALRKWCNSAYKYNTNKKCYEFDTHNLLKPADFPLYIKA